MYETLKEMGVTDLELVEKYTLRQEGDEDILKIYFKRKRGELFAHSMKYRHGRSTKMVCIDSGKNEYKEVSEISPTMQKAAAELEQIVSHDHDVLEVKARILSDLDHLEKVMQRKLEQLREDVDRLR